MTSFAELTKQVHLINDLILADMTCEDSDSTKEAVTFSKHLLATKYWFARISYANKKKYLLALLHDVRSAWALSLLLKSLWNCRPKDAVLSVSEPKVYTSYDQVPMDHNRTALPAHILAQVMKSDRIWFYSLDPESQALVLSELTTVAGGPAMWEMLRLAQRLYERNRDLMLKSIQECIVVNDNVKSEKSTELTQVQEKSAVDARHTTHVPQPSDAQKAMEANLTMWNGTIKSMRDSLKLEELELTFNDGTKRKMWKVNRPKPENIETVDFVQLLPAAIGKRILLYLPRAQLGDYAKVNKYWAYLVEELKAELAARIKIDADCERLNELLLRYETSLEMFIPHGDQANQPSSLGVLSTLAPSHRARFPQPSLKASEKSAGAYSHRQFISEKLTKPTAIQKPIRNLDDLSERLERRGAADENIWKWCECILAHAKKHKKIRRIKNPSVATYFTNRALCHLKMKRWDATCQDCRRALDIDNNQVKGHFFLGQALVELDCYDEAIKHLHRANDLAREQKLNFGDDIAAQIRIARKKRWNLQEEKRISQEIELQSYLNRLINDDMQRRIEAMKLDISNKDEINTNASKIEDECNNYRSELNILFSKMDERRRKRDVPDYLCGKISFEILNEPVITPSGITYEKKDIEEHLERVGHFDPVTRVKLTADQLIPNFTMKEVVDAFLQDNEWALDY